MISSIQVWLNTLFPDFAAIGLGAARMLPMVWLIPVFGGPTLPSYIRLGLSLGLSCLCYPYLAGRLLGVPSHIYLLLFLRELAVGATLGFILSLPFRSTEMAGRLTDILRGSNMAEVIAPLSDTRSSPLAGLYLLFSVLTFFYIGGVRFLVFGLSRSYEAFPIIDLRSTFPSGAQLFSLVLIASSKLFSSCVIMAAPALVSLLIADVVLGLIGSSTPAIPLHFLGMPMKAFLGIGIVLLSLSFLEIAFGNTIISFMKLFDSFMAFLP